MSKVAISEGLSPDLTRRSISSTKYLPEVIDLDRTQKAFRLSFEDFSQRAINDYRLINGRKNISRFVKTFEKIESEYGVPAEVVTAFWAMESDFGEVQGTFHTLSALGTLGFDCRRSELFQRQYVAALKLIENNELELTSTGAWAGEFGQIQMLPVDILRFGRDGDNDGKVRLSQSSKDTILTAAYLISNRGWVSGQPWLDEVILPKSFSWEMAGLGRPRIVSDWIRLGVLLREKKFPEEYKKIKASLILPQGKKGPKFLAYPNFNLFLKWNDSFIYSVTAAYLANRLKGDKEYISEQPEQILNKEEMIKLQFYLSELGLDVGGLDGILGAKTRQAVRNIQLLLGFPADSWPTLELLSALSD